MDVSSPPPPTSLENKLLGTQALSLSDLPLALHHYTLALLSSPPLPASLIPLHLNLALTYLRIGTSPRSALASATQALELGAEGEQRRKACFRAAQALYRLECWDEAGRMLEKLDQGVAVPGKESMDWHDKIRRRKNERDRGEYDWFRMMQGTTIGGPAADYVGPVEVAEIPGKGRGVVATREIKEGELVMLVKPFASVFEDELSPAEKKTQEGGINPVTGLVDSITQIKLALKIQEKLETDPSREDVVSLLFAGPASLSPPPVFPLSALLPNPDLTPPAPTSLPSLKQISLAIAYNSFTPRPLPSTALHSTPLSAPNSHPPSALYLLPSLLNHSCLPSTSWTFFLPLSGSPLALTARRTIPPGEELTQSYASGLDYDARSLVLAKHVPSAGCGCPLCVAEEADGPDARERRRGLLRVLKEELVGREPSWEGVRSLENLLQAVKGTYAGRGDARGEALKPDLWEACHALSDALSYLAFRPTNLGSRRGGREMDVKEKDALAKRSMEVEIEGLRACGVTFVADAATTTTAALPSPPFLTLPHAREEACVGSCFVVASVYEMLGEEALARQWVDEARRVEGVSVAGGGEKRVWKKRWSGVGGEYGVERLV